MDILWPGFLALLGVIPILIAIYIWLLRRRRVAVRYSSLSLVREALPRQSWLRRHLPFILFLVALASLVFAITRPVAVVTVPSGQATIVLAMDVSRSMCSTDIAPTRLQAAKDAALMFVDSQESRTQIGIVAFAGFAEVIQMPTADQELLEDAIQSLTTGRRTAIGSGILKALEVVAEVDSSVAPVTSDPSSGIVVTPVPDGAFAPDIIVLLTDGASNTGILPAEAAQMAADRGVRVYTIGFGTEQGNPNPYCGQFQGQEPWGGGFGGGGGFGFGGQGFRRGIDEETLKLVADITKAEYYSAESARELQEVFRGLPTYLIMKHETTEISAWFAGLGAIAAMAAVLLAMLWRPLP
jgi:Ca-activated chloride channel family protein